ncbi:MAG TPA: response regulator transcription factor [Spirochaetota bacterium]|nr:response regulator transcription factor [Spirochaetota bacterium]HPJ36308.1 response regulator transcription factor [Spirochaetota bacterium]
MNSEKNGLTNILIVDDHPIVANGIQQLIDREPDMKVINSVQDAENAVKSIDKNLPDLVIVDISLKGSTNGIDLIKGLRKRYPKINSLVLSMHDENLYAERAIKAGAKGYIMKNDLTDNIIRAIRIIMKGNLYLSENITSKLLNNMVNQKGDDETALIKTLSDREFEVFQHISNGIKTSDIAKNMNISVKTVEAHKLRIKNKLNVTNSTALTKFAIEWKHKASAENQAN